MPLPDDRDDASALSRNFIQRFRLAALVLVVVVVLAAALIVFMGWHRELSLEALIRHRAAVEALISGNRVAALAVFVVLYAIAAGSSLPGVVFLTIGGGAVFGGLVGGFAAVTGATAGATAVFLIAKTALGTLVAGWAGPLAARLAGKFRDDAFNYLLFMRLVPIFPFFLTNLLPALCGVRLLTFVGATFLGIIPATLAYAFFGAGLDSVLAAEDAHYRSCVAAGRSDCRVEFDPRMVLTPQLIAGLVALGIAALIPVVLRRFRSRLGGDP